MVVVIGEGAVLPGLTPEGGGNVGEADPTSESGGIAEGPPRSIVQAERATLNIVKQ